MGYAGESQNWNRDKHCEKLGQIHVIDEWVAVGLATHMSKEDKISAFLKKTPKDSKSSVLGIARSLLR